MRFRTGYFSFILAFFLCSAMLFMYLASAKAVAQPDMRAYLVEKRYYAVSDMEFSMYQQARRALAEAKENSSAAMDALDAAGILLPEAKAFSGTAREFASQYGKEIAKYYVLERLLEDSRRLKSVYPDYDISFWCGPNAQSNRGRALAMMLETGTAQAPEFALPLDSAAGMPACAEFMAVNEDSGTGAWALAFYDYTGLVPVQNSYQHVGIGMSVYDGRLNQSSIHSITRIGGVRAP
ncbi:MAG: hypothetical protein WC506_02520 [Candidatus Micrarchaeia archaeon]